MDKYRTYIRILMAALCLLSLFFTGYGVGIYHQTNICHEAIDSIEFNCEQLCLSQNMTLLRSEDSGQCWCKITN